VDYQTLKWSVEAPFLTVQFLVPALSLKFLEEFHALLDQFEKDSHLTAIILTSEKKTLFCAGLNLKEVADGNEEKIDLWTKTYFKLLKRLTHYPKIIISYVEGKAIAGALGLIAASDLVIANKEASFKLTELLWGLIPAIIAPFLVRKVGFNTAKVLTLTCKTITAVEAINLGLVDALEDEKEAILKQISKMDLETIITFKSYFESISLEDEERAASTTKELLLKEKTLKRLREFLEKGTLPN
jgi:polyketide biosynthesis enoyl-CoA hydratase PksH